MAKGTKIPKMTPARAAMIGLMREYLAAVMDPFVTLLEIHKLMYFLVAYGEPIDRLSFTKGPYGPYSETLRHVLNDTEGYFTQGFGDGEDAPEKPIKLLSEGVTAAQAFLRDHDETRTRLEKVTSLIAGFETPYGMELLATVHWVAKRDGAQTASEAIDKVHGWSDRKRQLFQHRHIELAWQVLERHQLLPG
jgi:O-acetyl-ADP-ribose deacetylase (regulator of RNase III)